MLQTSKVHRDVRMSSNVWIILLSQYKNMNDRFTHGLSVLFLALLGCVAVASDKHHSKPPNFVVILVDDLGFMDIGANNPNCFYDTPNIDGLASSGMRFTNGYAANPVC